ncbi:hypothetical protein BDV10DRAFT_166366 [Aspergillus recurvatus]
MLPWNAPGNLRDTRCARDNAMEMDMIPLSELYHGLSIRYLPTSTTTPFTQPFAYLISTRHRPAQSQATTFVIPGT